MTKVFNGKLINTEVVFSFGKVQFDAQGIANIEPDENAKLALGVDGFRIADEKLLAQLNKSAEAVKEPSKSEVEKAIEKASSTEPIAPDFVKDEVEEPSVEVELVNEDMSHAKLDAKAKELGFEYPKDTKTKADKVKAINEFIQK